MQWFRRINVHFVHGPRSVVDHHQQHDHDDDHHHLDIDHDDGA